MESKLFGCIGLSPTEQQQVNGGFLELNVNTLLTLFKQNLSANVYTTLKKDFGAVILFSKYGV